MPKGRQGQRRLADTAAAAIKTAEILEDLFAMFDLHADEFGSLFPAPPQRPPLRIVM